MAATIRGAKTVKSIATGATSGPHPAMDTGIMVAMGNDAVKAQARSTRILAAADSTGPVYRREALLPEVLVHR